MTLSDSVAPLADPATRLAAKAIDGLFTWSIAGVFAVAGMVLGSPELVFFGAVAAALTSAIWLAASLVLLHRYGQTIGKRIMGIRILSEDGSPVPLGRLSWMRMALPFVAELLPFVGPVFAAANVAPIFGTTRRCVHDHLARTIVVNVRRT